MHKFPFCNGWKLTRVFKCSIELILFGAVLFSATSFVSCDKDDDQTPADPVGTVSLNMMNEDNGKTELGNSDVYIDNGNNFYSDYCWLSSLGKKNGLGSISDILLQPGTNKAAVEPGNAYQIFNQSSIMKFPSGKLALSIDESYYNVYVVSQIKKDNADIIGANVKFVLMDVPDNGLPTYNSSIGTFDIHNYDTWEVEIDLGTSDFEYETTTNTIFNDFEHEKVGNKLVIRLIEYGNRLHDIDFYIRIKDSYTYVYVHMK